MPLRRLRTHVDAHRASGCPWQNQPTNFKKKSKKRHIASGIQIGLEKYGGSGLS